MLTPELGGLGTRLPPEIIELVVEQLALSPGPDPDHARSGRHALATLMRVSHAFYDIIGPVLYSRIVLTRNNADALFYGFKRSDGIRKTKHVFPSKEAYEAEFNKFRDLFCDSKESDDPKEDIENSGGSGQVLSEHPSLDSDDPYPGRCALNIACAWREGRPMPDDCGEKDNFPDQWRDDGSSSDGYLEASESWECDEDPEYSGDWETISDDTGSRSSSRRTKAKGELKDTWHTDPEGYESLSETDDEAPFTRHTHPAFEKDSFERKRELLGYCRVLHVVQLPNRNLLRDLSKVSWAMSLDHLVVSSRAILRALKSETYRDLRKLNFEADDFLPKLFDLARHSCITWPITRRPTVKQIFRFVRRAEGLDREKIERIRRSIEHWWFGRACDMRARGNLTFHALDTVPFHSCQYTLEPCTKRYFSHSISEGDTVRSVASDLLHVLDETAPEHPTDISTTFEFIRVDDADMEQLRAEVDRGTTEPRILFLSAFYDDMSVNQFTESALPSISRKINRMARSREYLKAYLENRAQATLEDTFAAWRVEEGYTQASWWLKESETDEAYMDELFGDKLDSLREKERAMFPPASERIKITSLEDAEPCAACGRKDFEEEANLSDLIAATQCIPLMTNW